MNYLWLKAFHIISVVIWISGMFIAAITVTAVSASKSLSDGRAGILEAVRRWDRRATSPAMLLAWSLGLAMATQGGWFGSPWLTMKLAVVVALSGLHGMLSGTLRRLARADRSPAISGYAPPAILGALVVIVLLVVVKPL